MLILLAAFVAMTSANLAADLEDLRDLKTLMDIWKKPRTLTRERRIFPSEGEIIKMSSSAVDQKLQLTSFQWSNCLPGSDVSIKNLSVSPNPIHMPGQIQVSLGVDIQSDFGDAAHPVSLDIEMKKKVFIWIELPCIGKIGSCSFANACSLDPLPSPCPEPLPKYKIPCRCPFKKGSYYLPSSTFELKPNANLPSWLSKGDYSVKATLKSAAKNIGCVQLYLSLA